MTGSVFGSGKCYLLSVKDGKFYAGKFEENWVSAGVDKRGEFDKYFVYQQCVEDGKTFCDRIAKPGYEYLQNNHDSIDKIIEEVKKHDSKKNMDGLDSGNTVTR